MDLGSFGEILAGSTPVAPTLQTFLKHFSCREQAEVLNWTCSLKRMDLLSISNTAKRQGTT
jgi:hypothetical protein